MIEIRNLSKTFKTADGNVEALKDVSITVEDGKLSYESTLDKEDFAMGICEK